MTARRRFTRALAASLVFGLLCTTAAAAEGPPGKSGDESPVKLTLLNGDMTLNFAPAVRRFVDRVAALSNGALTVDVRPQADGHAGYERRIVQEVQANGAELAWVGTRVWDTFGVKSFRALHAPMLVDSYALETAVLRSDLPARMLAGLRGHGVVGLAVLGEHLRHPVGVDKPLRGVGDYRGITFRAMTSVTQKAAVRALGAKPSELAWAELNDALRSGRVDGLEVDLPVYLGNGYPSLAPYMTVNVALWPRTAVLFANAAALDKLSERQRGWIRKAAREAAAYSLTTYGDDKVLLRVACSAGGEVAIASPGQLAALRKAFAPVYASLRTHQATADMIRKIEALKRKVKARPPAVPKGCRVPNPPGSTTPRPGAPFPDGVYRFRRTEADVLRLWPDVDEQNLRLLTGIFTVTFDKRRFRVVVSAGGAPGCRRGDGVYEPRGQFVTVSWTSFHGCPLLTTLLPTPPLKLRWSTEGDLLRFRLAEPAARIDSVHWESKTFVRIR